MPFRVLPAILLLAWLSGCDSRREAIAITPAETFGPPQLAVVINESDPDSVATGEYYARRRGIPDENVVRVSFPPDREVMQPSIFRTLKSIVDLRTPEHVQGYALAWTTPYRVGCMSITTAFTAGFDAGFCAADCSATRESPYYRSNSRRPFRDHGWRPSMLLAGRDERGVRALIDRGIAADGTQPDGTAYLVNSSDAARNTRARFYHGIRMMQGDRFRIQIQQRDIVRHRDDIMFYFTGLRRVDNLDSNTFLPGAIADHLTSFGGVLDGSGGQMSSLEWLQAGATGSYGAVTEPCNFPQKFPRPDIVIDHYLSGETLLESYWKSVEWPGQGIFIGEPLAKPFQPTPPGTT